MKSSWFSPEAYLEQEKTATERHEYFNGQIVMMTSGTHNHEMVRLNTIAALHRHGRHRKWTVYGSNMKIWVETNGLITYPDAMVVCGGISFAAERKDIVINPVLIVEVLSDSTQSYDRGDKFALYRGVPTFAHYLLFHQDQALIEYHRKTKSGWLLTEIEGIDAVLTVDALDLQLTLNELYEGVDWLPAAEE